MLCENRGGFPASISEVSMKVSFLGESARGALREDEALLPSMQWAGAGGMGVRISHRAAQPQPGMWSPWHPAASASAPCRVLASLQPSWHRGQSRHVTWVRLADGQGIHTNPMHSLPAPAAEASSSRWHLHPTDASATVVDHLLPAGTPEGDLLLAQRLQTSSGLARPDQWTSVRFCNFSSEIWTPSLALLLQL